MGNLSPGYLSVFASDLAQNIYAELFGIVVTVFLINRLLARREDRKWRTATEINLRRLVLVTNEICADFGPRVGLSAAEFGFNTGESPPSMIEGSRMLADKIEDLLQDEGGLKARVASWAEEDWTAYNDECGDARLTLVEILTSFGGRLDEQTSAAAYRLIQAIDTYASGIDLAQVYRRESLRSGSGNVESQEAVLARAIASMSDAAVDIAAQAVSLKRLLHQQLTE